MTIKQYLLLVITLVMISPLSYAVENDYCLNHKKIARYVASLRVLLTPKDQVYKVVEQHAEHQSLYEKLIISMIIERAYNQYFDSAYDITQYERMVYYSCINN